MLLKLHIKNHKTVWSTLITNLKYKYYAMSVYDEDNETYIL